MEMNFHIQEWWKGDAWHSIQLYKGKRDLDERSKMINFRNFHPSFTTCPIGVPVGRKLLIFFSQENTTNNAECQHFKGNYFNMYHYL